MLIDYLPSFYLKSKEVVNIQETLNDEVNELQANANDLITQIFVETATWGLKNWEDYLDIKTDVIESFEVRRSRIITRLRGQGTTTKAMVKSFCEGYAEGNVVITEMFNDYLIKIKFIGPIIGSDESVIKIRKLLNETKPAHLGFDISNDLPELGEQVFFIASIVTQGYHYTLTSDINTTYKGDAALRNGGISVIGNLYQLS